MASTRVLVSNSPRPFTNPLVTVPSASITIGITVTFIFHSFFFQFPSKILVLVSLFSFFQFYSMVCRDGKVHNSASSLFIIIICFNLYLIHFYLSLSVQTKSSFPSFATQQYIKVYSTRWSHLVRWSHWWKTDSRQALLSLCLRYPKLSALL